MRALYGVCVSTFFFYKQNTAYEMRISDWSSDVCSTDLAAHRIAVPDVVDLRTDDRGLMLFGRAAFGCDDEAGAAISDIGPHQLDGAQLVTAGDPAGDDQDTVIELAHGFDEGHRVEAPRLSAGT